jgi:hypothetical protein
MKKSYFRVPMLVVAALSLTFCVTVPSKHPAYLHALEDLRAARWMIEHRPGDWVRSVHEVDAVRQIDWAITEIKKAAIDDGRDANWHPPVDELPTHPGRLHKALEYLDKAHNDVAREEDNTFARGLRNRAITAIDAATSQTQGALKD